MIIQLIFDILLILKDRKTYGLLGTVVAITLAVIIFFIFFNLMNQE